MAKEAKGQYINGKPVYYRDENTRKMISQDAFSDLKTYTIGDYCIYDNTLYRFTATKSAGAWDDTAVEAVTITGELNSNFLRNTTYVYVSPDGSDETGNGTSSNPWQTISYAINKCPVNTYSYTYTIYVQPGTYTEKISIYGKNVTINLKGNVILDANDTSGNAITAGRNAMLTITAASDTSYTFTIKNAKYGFNVQTKAYCAMSSYISSLDFINVVYRCFYTASYGKIRGLAKFTVDSTCANAVAYADADSSIILYNSNGSTISEDVTLSSAFTCTTMSHMLIRYVTIPTSVTTGLNATYGGIIVYANMTNNATTAYKGTAGGRVYAGNQTDIPNY